MSTTEKPKSGAVDHYHAWRAGPTAGEVTVLRKAGPVFKTRKAALEWLRDRRGKLGKVFLCRDDLCPALDLGGDDEPVSTSPF